MDKNAVLKLETDGFTANANDIVVSLQKAYATISFNPKGIIKDANDLFLSALGYDLDEVRGQHHRMFVESSEASSADYRRFWDELAAGITQTRQFKRVTKSGEPIWINASYVPIRDQSGKVTEVIKLAQDKTAEHLQVKELESKLAAIDAVQAVISFDLNGTILDANANFLSVLGYELDEIVGKHHSLFIETEESRGAEYKAFWERLNRGEHDAGKYKRVGKGGKEVWIQASYNPMLDLNKKPYKIVKFATDITEDVKRMDIVAELSSAASRLSEESEELSAAADQMLSNSTKTSDEATGAAASAEEVSAGVRTVATNTEEMQASIKEIARNASEVSSMANAARNEAQETNLTIGKLGESSKEIGNVIKVISSIAQQTNLLALNATIEAARAGEAGRGFAVVANEVKELAKQTAKATEDITGRVGAIQGDSTEAVKAILSIGTSIDKLNAIAGSIAASVEEQSVTTSEVARVVRDSSVGVEGITENIRSVSGAALETNSGAQHVLKASRSLQELAKELKSLVTRVSA